MTRSDVREQAFARWVVPEIGVLLRVATTLTGQVAEARTSCRTRSSGPTGRWTASTANTRAWLLTILRNTNLNRSRRRLPVLFREPDPEVGESAAMTQPPLTPEELVVDAVFDDAVEQALAALPPPASAGSWSSWTWPGCPTRRRPRCSTSRQAR